MTTTSNETGLAAAQPAPPQVYAAISRVMADIGTSGIAKDRRNQEQKFNFRGIDDALLAFSPLLVKHGLIVAPSYADKVIEARQTKSGGTTYNVSLSGTFTFTSIHDGSQWVVGPFFGEANDGQDKAVSKATSVAERNMFYLTFVVPHEAAIGGDPDADGEAPQTEEELNAISWVTRANKVGTPDEYLSERETMMSFYGAQDSDPATLRRIPAAVKRAFSEAKNEVMPKDEP